MVMACVADNRGGLAKADWEEIGRRVEALVNEGRLEARGDVTLWRHSEVRLPSPHGPTVSCAKSR